MGRHRSPQRTRRQSWHSPSRRERYHSKRSRSRSRSYSRSRSRSRSRSMSPNDERGYRLHIADLSVDCTRKDLEIAFEKFGRLKEVWLARSPQCFAFVVFEHSEDAKDAIEEMHGKKLCGSRIRVTKARPRTRGQRTYRSYNPNLRCYECGKRGHFSRDCRLNDSTDTRKRHSKTMSVQDLINWDINDDDVIRFNMPPEHLRRSRTRSRSRSRSRSSSSSSSSSDRSRRRRRSRHSSSGSSHKGNKDENANSKKGETPAASTTTPPATTTITTTAPTVSPPPTSSAQENQESPSKPQQTPQPAVVPPGMLNTFAPVAKPAEPQVVVNNTPQVMVKSPEVRTVSVNNTSMSASASDVLDIALPGSDGFL